MPLTPEDVANKQFTSTRLKPGYDEQEVDEFLDEVEAELTRLHRENEELRAKLASAQRALAAAGEGRTAATVAAPAPAPAPTPPPTAAVPSGPQTNPTEAAAGILAMAQRTADEHIAEARTQADRIVGEARTRADQLRREAEEKHQQTIGALENERVTLERKLDELRAFEREYRSRLKTYLEAQLRELESHGDAAPPRPAGAGSPSGVGGHGSQGQSAPSGPPRTTSPFAPGAPVGQPSQNQSGPTGLLGLDRER